MGRSNRGPFAVALVLVIVVLAAAGVVAWAVMACLKKTN